ncbi:MAG: 50S ribosomal protein L13 [Oscillospiraceae bacterium]
MSTTTFMANRQNTVRKWYVLDAADKPLGRTAVIAAKLLRGKHKPEFTPNADCGDFVIILNTEKAILTGNKLEQKLYRHHSGWVGGLKEVKYRLLMQDKPEFAMQLAVKGMLPHNSVGASSLGRLKLYRGAEHDQAAQKPEAWTQE